MLFIGYFFAWFGHFVVERNRVRAHYTVHTLILINRQPHIRNRHTCRVTSDKLTRRSCSPPKQPATFTYAVYSLMADFVMWWDTFKELVELARSSAGHGMALA